MGKLNLSTIIKILKFWFAISPVLALAYLVMWLIQIFNEDLFLEIDMVFGTIPLIMDSICYVTIDANGVEVTMGYVYTALLIIITTGISMKLINKLDKKNRKDKENELEKRIQKIELQKIKDQEKKKIPPTNINFYCGLFEMKFEYYNPIEKSLDDLEKLKVEYAKMIATKLKEKYPAIKFIVSDKIFMYSAKFENFDGMVTDLSKLYKILYNLDYEKSIKTDLLLSFWSDYKKVDSKKAFKIVSKINDLNFLNKVVVADKFPLRYEIEKIKKYEVVSLGPSRLDVPDENGDDWEMDLFYLKKQS